MTQPTHRASLRHRIPRLIGWFFGALWAYLGASALPGHYARAGYALAVVVAFAFLARLWGVGPPAGATRPLFRAPAYLISVVAEILAINVAAALLQRIGAQQQIYPVVGFIVGLHFIGLWIATRSPRFLHITAGMCAVSLLSMFLPFTWHTIGLRHFVLGLGNALVLWIAASGNE